MGRVLRANSESVTSKKEMFPEGMEGRKVPIVNSNHEKHTKAMDWWLDEDVACGETSGF